MATRIKLAAPFLCMRRNRSEDIDSIMDSLNEWDRRQEARQETSESTGSSRVFIGRVDQFFAKINVAAIKLEAELKVGDIIEIGSDEEAIRQRVSSMQINRNDVYVAGGGEEVGIKLKYQVAVGSEAYRIRK